MMTRSPRSLTAVITRSAANGWSSRITQANPQPYVAPVSGRFPKSEVANLTSHDFNGVRFMPARQFAKDLRALIEAKHSMTRRQWESLLEAILRLAAVAHVTWLCDVHARIWRCLSEALEGAGPVGPEATRELIFPASAQYMAYGGKALNGLKDKASSYLLARLSYLAAHAKASPCVHD